MKVVLKISLCVHSIRVFAKFSGDPYYEPLAWFMIEAISFVTFSIPLDYISVSVVLRQCSLGGSTPSSLSLET